MLDHWGIDIQFLAGASRLALKPTQGHKDIFLQEVKQPVHEAICTTASSIKVKKLWSYTITPQYNLILIFLIKHKDNFIST
jgi:hypothetical protein